MSLVYLNNSMDFGDPSTRDVNESHPRKKSRTKENTQAFNSHKSINMVIRFIKDYIQMKNFVTQK